MVQNEEIHQHNLLSYKLKKKKKIILLSDAKMAFEELDQLIKCKPNSNRKKLLRGDLPNTTANFIVSGKTVSL